MSWLKITDFEERAIQMLMPQYRDRVRFRAFAALLGKMCQAMEDDLDQLMIDRLLENAVGKQLDAYGKILDEPRGGLDDEDYRRFIRAKILINLSIGTPDENFIEVWQAITGSPETSYKEYYPATILIQALISPDLSPAVVNRIGRSIRKVKPAGVRLHPVIYTDQPFEVGLAIDDDTVLGLDEGELAAVI